MIERRRPIGRLAAFRLGRRYGAQDWAGRSAFVLACGLAFGWAGALLLAAWEHGPVSQQGANLLSTLGGAIAGAVATYLGSTLHQGGHMAPEKPAHQPSEPDAPARPEHPDRPGGPGPRPDQELPERERPQPKQGGEGRRGD